MGFLNAEIAGLLAMAVLAGGALVYWWIGPDLKAVTFEYERLRSELDDLESMRRAKAEADVTIAALDAENAHLERRLADEIEWRRSVGPKLENMTAALAELDNTAATVEFDDTAAAVELKPRSSTPSTPTPAPATSRRRTRGGNLLRSASQGPPDDLKRIRGIGPKLEKMLHDIGVFYFWQVCEWSPADVQFIDGQLDVFRGRVERDDWVAQARVLARDGQARRDHTPASPIRSRRSGSMPGDALKRWPQIS